MLERVNAATEQAGVAVRVSTRQVETHRGCRAVGFAGSPTILIGGRDPFSRPGTAPALACRFYSTPEGLAVSPTVDQLVRALGKDRDRIAGG